MTFAVVGGTQSTGYEISNSLRFNDDDSANLSRTVGTPTNEKIYTVSVWVKRGNIGTNNTIIGSPPEGDRILVGDRFEFFTNGSASSYLRTNALARDSAAWYHVVVAYDVTQGTAANRVKYYVNGEQLTFDLSTTFPSQDDTNGKINKSGTTLEIGHGHNGYCDGYMSDFNLVDGQALDPTYFGETNDNGVWVPKAYTGTYGNNGFFLEFQQTGTSANSSGMGADTSGNDNHFTANNLAATDVTTDTPTNNFCTLNPLIGNSGITYSEGNLQFSQYYNTASTIAVANGKWYLEMKILNDNTYNPVIGIAQTHTTLATIDVNDYHGNVTDSYGISREGNLFANGSNIGSQGFTLAQNDIVGVALDLDSGTKTIKWYKNGSQVATRNLSETQSNPYVFGTYASSSQAGQGSFNFGNPAFSISSGNADANGYGNFEYAPPSGYYALCTKNLAEFG